MPMPTEDDYKLFNKKQDDAIAELVEAVRSEPQEVRRSKYSKPVYEAAWKLVEACKALKAVYNYRLTDIDEYNAEVERRRQIGLSLDPATAEITFWWGDIHDPYDILDRKYHVGGSSKERFARLPCASNNDWVWFGDLPEATCKALCAAVGLLPLDPDDDIIDDIINRPPAVQQ